MKIEWNKVTWYSKLIALILFVVLPFVGFWLGTRYGATIAPHPVNSIAAPTSTDYYSNPAEWQIDANNTAGEFSIAYPIDFDTQDNYSAAPSSDWRLGANGEPGIAYFTLTIPRAFEPQTNFVDATLKVGTSGNDIAVADCLQDEPMTATSSVTINGINFTKFVSSGVGAGNYYDTTSYRTLHAGKCYAIEYTIHSAQILNYPAEYHIRPFNESEASALLDRIVGTFKFI